MNFGIGLVSTDPLVSDIPLVPRLQDELPNIEMAADQAESWVEKAVKFHSCVIRIIRPNLFGFLLWF